MTGKPKRQAEVAPSGPAIHWHLRQIMATRGTFSTTDLISGLTERGIELSREQIYLSTGHPHPRTAQYPCVGRVV